MIQRDYLIIGGGIAGVSVCNSIRQYDPKGTVTLVNTEPHPPYNRPSLSKELLQKALLPIEKIAETPFDWFKKKNIDLRLGTYIRAFNIDRRLAVLENGQTIEFKKACLATGSQARRPAVAGFNLGNVAYLRSYRDLLAIREILEHEKQIVIVGSGFLGAEISSSLLNSTYNKKKDLKITILSRDKMILQDYFDPQLATWLTEQFTQAGIQLMLNENLNGFEGKTIIRNIQTKSGNRFPVGLAIVAIGTEPNLQLVQNTPLNSPSGCPVNDYLETDEKGIYAVGDIALYPDRIFGGTRRTTNYDVAKAQGLIVGANMTGKKRQKFEMVSTCSSSILGMQFNFVGDFTTPHLMPEIEGSLEKKSFIAKYKQGDTLIAAILCNQKEAVVKKLQDEIKSSVLSKVKKGK